MPPTDFPFPRVLQRCLCRLWRPGQRLLHLLPQDEGGQREGLQGAPRPHRVRESLEHSTSYIEVNKKVFRVIIAKIYLILQVKKNMG